MGVGKLEVVRMGMRDNDSFNVEVRHGGITIGYGHLNFMSNMAHIDLLSDWHEMEDDIVKGIEERTIQII